MASEFQIGQKIKHKKTGKIFTVRGISVHRGVTKLNLGPSNGRLDARLFEIVEESKPVETKAPAKKSSKKKKE